MYVLTKTKNTNYSELNSIHFGKDANIIFANSSLFTTQAHPSTHYCTRQNDTTHKKTNTKYLTTKIQPKTITHKEF